MQAPIPKSRSLVSPPTSRRQRVDGDVALTLAIALAISLVNGIWPTALSPARVTLGLVEASIVPGYLVCALIFPRQSELPGVERWGLSFILSVVIVIAIALGISEVGLPLGIKILTWSLSSFCGLAAVGLVFRRRPIPSQEVYQLFPRSRMPDPGLYLSLALALTLSIATAFVVGTNLAATRPAFYISSPSGRLEGYPFQVIRGTPYPLALHVTNPSARTLTYTLTVRDNGHRIVRRTIAIVSHQIWVWHFTLPTPAGITDNVLDFSLFPQKGGASVRKLWIRYQTRP